eukprot:gene24546-biopygen16432
MPQKFGRRRRGGAAGAAAVAAPQAPPRRSVQEKKEHTAPQAPPQRKKRGGGGKVQLEARWMGEVNGATFISLCWHFPRRMHATKTSENCATSRGKTMENARLGRNNSKKRRRWRREIGFWQICWGTTSTVQRTIGGSQRQRHVRCFFNEQLPNCAFAGGSVLLQCLPGTTRRNGCGRTESKRYVKYRRRRNFTVVLQSSAPGTGGRPTFSDSRHLSTGQPRPPHRPISASGSPLSATPRSQQVNGAPRAVPRLPPSAYSEFIVFFAQFNQ